jgi:hypothetical protein
MVIKIKKSEHSMDNQIFLFKQLKYNVHNKTMPLGGALACSSSMQCIEELVLFYLSQTK